MNDYSEKLNHVIILSKSILVKLDNALEYNTKNSAEENTEINAENNHAISLLSVERNKLIEHVFNDENTEYYPPHLTLINQIIALDEEIIEQVKKNKMHLKADLLMLKKNKKATNLYTNTK